MTDFIAARERAQKSLSGGSGVFGDRAVQAARDYLALEKQAVWLAQEIEHELRSLDETVWEPLLKLEKT